VRAIALACLVACGCFLEPPPGAIGLPSRTDIVGCITREHVGRRRSTWWLGSRVASRDQVERALADSSVSHDQWLRHRREDRAALALFFAGMATVLASMGGMFGWISRVDDGSELPLVMLAPVAAGYALALTGVGIGVHADSHWRRAIDEYNDAATANDRCPP
jgi:hypothetical protein